MNKTKKEFDNFSAIMWGVAEEFGGKISKNGMKLKFKALSEFTIKEIENAGMWIVKNRIETFPAVPLVREFTEAIMTIESMRLRRIDMEIAEQKRLQIGNN